MLCSPKHTVSVTIFQKSSLIYKYLYKCDVCYIGCTTQRLDIRMNQQIPSNTSTNTLDYTTASSNQNSFFAIARHLMDNLAVAAAYNSTMFIILEKISKELHLSILEALFITKYQPTRNAYALKALFKFSTYHKIFIYMCVCVSFPD